MALFLCSLHRLFRFAPLCAALTVALAAWIGTFGALADDAAPAEKDAFSKAHDLLLTGKYDEAAEALARLDSQNPAVVIGLAQVRMATGAQADAEKLLSGALEKQPPGAPARAALSARLAELALERGDFAAAERFCKQANEQADAERPNLLTRWVEAELLHNRGKLDEAERAYHEFVDDYNARELDDAEELLLVGKAAAHYARWNRLSDQFHFLVNELYPSILRIEPKFWPAHLEAGLLFLEKFNQAEAAREFQQALAINPRAAEVHAAIAHLALQRYDMDQARRSTKAALEINPNLLTARHAQADLLMSNFQTREAADYLEKAQSLNPVDEATLGRLAAAYAALDGYLPGQRSDRNQRVDRLIAEVEARNAHAGEFYFALATRLEERRKFDLAEHFFRQSLARMPRMVGPHAGLGLLYMRLGNEDDARKFLREAFEIDPFNVRVSNSLKVLEVLEGYETLETEHFVIRFDPAKDKLLARYAAAHLERVYPEHCKLFGYQPAGKSLFEIFNHAKHTPGHGWFSARMVGLPYIGTVGACAGKMVAMASPNEGKHPFNWARVLKHEFVHVINLQQTRYNIPHWFTEALAVWNEGFPRPREWNQLLLERVPKGETFNLDTINLGFVRPETSENWQMAYCQAELYAEYLLERFGDDAFAKLLAAYADNLETPAALQKCFGVDQATFEEGYREHLKRVVEGIKAGSAAAPESRPAEIEHAVEAHPDDAEAWARLALSRLERESYAEARKAASEALRRKPKQALASFVVARLQVLIGEDDQALATLEEANDPEAPEEHLANLLASLKLKAGDFEAAERLYQTMAQRQPQEPRWLKALARVYLLSKQDGPLAQTLARLAEFDADDVAIRKKLAALALAREDWEQAAHWSRRSLDIDVMDAETHRMLAAALLERGSKEEAVAEYAVAVELAPSDPRLWFALADAYLQIADKGKARQSLEQLLKLKPDYPGAADMLESLKP